MTKTHKKLNYESGRHSYFRTGLQTCPNEENTTVHVGFLKGGGGLEISWFLELKSLRISNFNFTQLLLFDFGKY